MSSCRWLGAASSDGLSEITLTASAADPRKALVDYQVSQSTSTTQQQHVTFALHERNHMRLPLVAVATKSAVITLQLYWHVCCLLNMSRSCMDEPRRMLKYSPGVRNHAVQAVVAGAAWHLFEPRLLLASAGVLLHQSTAWLRHRLNGRL